MTNHTTPTPPIQGVDTTAARNPHTPHPLKGCGVVCRVSGETDYLDATLYRWQAERARLQSGLVEREAAGDKTAILQMLVIATALSRAIRELTAARARAGMKG